MTRSSHKGTQPGHVTPGVEIPLGPAVHRQDEKSSLLQIVTGRRGSATAPRLIRVKLVAAVDAETRRNAIWIERSSGRADKLIRTRLGTHAARRTFRSHDNRASIGSPRSSPPIRAMLGEFTPRLMGALRRAR
jgi:hypothetical protein